MHLTTLSSFVDKSGKSARRGERVLGVKDASQLKNGCGSLPNTPHLNYNASDYTQIFYELN